LGADDREKIRVAVCDQLSHTWQGKRVDPAFIAGIGVKLPADLRGRLDAADRLAPIMTTASRISGNPRLIKRFLNALAIRMTISKAHGVGVDEAVLAKMLLFERCGPAKAYAQIASAVATDANGHPVFLESMEKDAKAGKLAKLEEPWSDAFSREWLALQPALGDKDLRGVLYVSREHAPVMTPEDGLSSEGAELLDALLSQPTMAAALKAKLTQLARAEIAVIMSRLLDVALQEQEWGTPDILDACLAICDSEPSEGNRLMGFLMERPGTQIRASIVPKIMGYAWTETVWQKWKNDPKVSKPVKEAIKAKEQ
jgi:predicted KAP-like P-loop ATPase